MVNRPTIHSYSSVYTVNTDIIHSFLDKDLSDDVLKIVSLLVPLDGLNEKGVSISVNMVPSIPKDSESGNETIDQYNDLKINITTALYARIVLDFASTADEAVRLIKSFNNHSSQGVNVHYIVADASGKSYVIEYIHNKLVVTEASIATNFYVAEGEYHKYGSGIDKYDTINEKMIKTPNMSIDEVKNTLMDIKEDETEWSVVYDLLNKEAIYYFRNNYDHGYKIKLDVTPETDDQNSLDDKDFDIVE
eukprot:jgi/Orpsp1_1/1189335/evm.model.d7180000071226.1